MKGVTLTGTGERITVIDALRGFSLIGICLIHAMQHFGAMGTMRPETFFPGEGSLNEIFSWLIRYLVFGKFFIIFSWLFGLSFFIQMDRAAKRGVDFRPRFLWRLVLLLIIGYLHGLVVRVDILLIYALLGFVLVLVYKWPTKLLAGITLFLFLGGATLVQVACKQLEKPAVEQVEQVSRETPRQQPRQANQRRHVPTFTETVQNNAWNGLVGKMNFQVSSGRLYLTMGLFLLGFIAGRIRLFERLNEFLGRLLKGALFAGVLLALLYIIQPYLPRTGWNEVSVYSWMQSTTTNLINLSTSYLWVVLVIEVYRSVRVQHAMKPLVSYGRMGLTNYIVQSVAGVFLFSGFGLDFSNLGVFLSVCVCLAYTVVQIAASHWWLKKFRYGPMEWVWRSGTYMRWQPLVR